MLRKFSDFATEETPLDGAKVKLDDIINQEINIVAFKLQNSKFSKNTTGKYATIQFTTEQCTLPRVIFTGSDVLIDQLERYKEHIPFQAVIKKINKYYTLS
jgi:hypothetical protein